MKNLLTVPLFQVYKILGPSAKKKFLGSFLFILVTLPGPAQNKTYYISPSGNDNNSGLTVSAPWKTTLKVSSFIFETGDTLLFQGGQKFYGNLKFESKNAPGMISSYGTAKATIYA